MGIFHSAPNRTKIWHCVTSWPDTISVHKYYVIGTASFAFRHMKVSHCADVSSPRHQNYVDCVTASRHHSTSSLETVRPLIYAYRKCVTMCFSFHAIVASRRCLGLKNIGPSPTRRNLGQWLKYLFTAHQSANRVITVHVSRWSASRKWLQTVTISEDARVAAVFSHDCVFWGLFSCLNQSEDQTRGRSDLAKAAPNYPRTVKPR